MTYDMAFTYKSASATLTVWEDEDSAAVSSVFASHRKRGHATELMKRITKVADALDLELLLDVVPFGEDNGMNRKQLKKFYAKYGFVNNGDSSMTRMRESER